MNLVQIAYTRSTGHIDEYLSDIFCRPENIEKAVKEAIEGISDIYKFLKKFGRVEIKGRDIFIYYVDIHDDQKYTVWSYHDVKLMGEN